MGGVEAASIDTYSSHTYSVATSTCYRVQSNALIARPHFTFKCATARRVESSFTKDRFARMTRMWRQNFPDAACIRLWSSSNTTLTILTRYTDSDIRHERGALSSSLASLIYRPAVSRMPFISSFTVLRHDLRRIRMRNDDIARASLARSAFVSFLPSFLPPVTVSVAWVYFARNFLVDSREMPRKGCSAKERLWPGFGGSRRVAAASGSQCGKSRQ